MLKNILWMVSGLALGLLIWAAYAQYKKAKDKRAAAAAEAAAAAVNGGTTPTSGTTPPSGTGTPAPTPPAPVRNVIQPQLSNTPTNSLS